MSIRTRTIGWSVAVVFLAAVPLLAAEGAGSTGEAPGFSSLLPPLVAILLALLFRQVIPALIVGVWVGASLAHGGPFVGAVRMLDGYAVGALVDADHVKIVLFSLLLGGMVGITSRIGGMRGMVEALAVFATNRSRGQVVTWLMGLVIFFDDYANTLVVGNTMRPVTDRLHISREKLAYIVDSTAAPVASLFLVSTWIGYQVSLIGDGLTQSGVGVDAYSLFLRSLPFNFYPILALLFVLVVGLTGRDFGPMLAAERRAATGKVLRDGAVPLSDMDGEGLDPVDGPHRWIDGLLPILTVLIVTFTTLWVTGRQGLAAAGDPRADTPFFSLGMQGLGAVLEQAASYDALLYASFSGCLVALALAVSRRALTLGDGLGAWTKGMRSLMPAMVILVLAWSISSICNDLNTAQYLSGLLERSSVGLGWVPLLIFVISAAAAFGTGSSWATMGIVIPIAIQTVVDLAGGGATAASSPVLYASVSAVLAGAIFGDHCSPISDTTVLSSMASGCDHVDHVRTQLPYAMAVAAIAIVFGYVPVGFGLPPVVGLLLGSAVVFAFVRYVATPSGEKRAA